MTAEEIRRMRGGKDAGSPYKSWHDGTERTQVLIEIAYQLALANERNVPEPQPASAPQPEPPMTCRSCHASTRDFKPYLSCGRCGAMLLRDAVPEPQAEPFGDNEQSRFIAGMKGAAARAGGFPKETPHGYAGRNAKAFIDGWEYCNDCLRDPNFKPPQPPDASAGECAGADVVNEAQWAYIEATGAGSHTACNTGCCCIIGMTAALRVAFSAIRVSAGLVAIEVQDPHCWARNMQAVLDIAGRRIGLQPDSEAVDAHESEGRN